MVGTLFLILATSIIGAIVGSFVVRYSYRVHRNIPTFKGEPNTCDSCGKRLSFLELIPVLNILYTKGKCTGCGVTYSNTSFKVECIFAVVTPIIMLLAYNFLIWLCAFLLVVGLVGYYIIESEEIEMKYNGEYV